jgi:ElaB/YqjD/DUF883 family membrane-anchored ribosome-binding protein
MDSTPASYGASPGAPVPTDQPVPPSSADNPIGTAAAAAAMAPAVISAAGAPLQAIFRDRFDAILPTIQRRWPEVARHTLEASRGSLDQVVDEISRQSGDASIRVKEQLLDLAHLTGEQARNVGDSLKPLEDQLEQLLDDLNSSLRPRLTKPVREKPLMALGIAAGVGLLLGMLLNSGRRSA